MLCESAERPPEGPEWRYELKLDGFRAIGRTSGRSVQLWSRIQKDFTCRFPCVVKVIAVIGTNKPIAEYLFMCSRFSLAEDNDFLAARLGVSAMALANYRPRYNIAPQQEHFIVTTEYENRELAPAKWGLMSNPGEHGRARYSIKCQS